MKILKYLLVIVLFANVSFAAPDVNGVVDEMFTRMQKEKSFAVMLDYVHWESAYKALSQAEKTTLGVNSAKEYRDKIGGFVKDPAKAFRSEMDKQMAMQELPPEQKKQLDQMMQAQIQQMEAKMKQEMEEFTKSSYKIVSSNVNGNKADIQVELTKPNGEVKTDQINLELIDNKWYIPTSEVAGGGPMSARAQ